MTEFREFQDGESIAGTRYKVIRLIGVGGMGSVYEVEHTELGKRFVLKALLRELTRREDLAQRLRNEWRALARLQHANIVTVTDAGTSGGGVPFYVMERLDGDTLAAHLKLKRRLHVMEAVSVAASVLDALSAAHDIGIIHRDVKPANIFLVRGGGVKLLDFGVAKIADASSVVTARGLAVGTPRYMSPEQARGERVDGRSDVYASGLILFEMIAGVGPFDDARDANELLLAHLARVAPALSTLVKGVSPELEQILVAMLAKDCRARPAHAREVAQQLRDFTARYRQPPATDAPTVQAGYSAPTVVPGYPSPRLKFDPTTRPEGIPAGRRRDPSVSDAALTQRLLPRPQTTPVTLSISTGEAFTVSPGPNTTFVSPPSFAGNSTLELSSLGTPASSLGALSFAPVERIDRTEMLDFTPPAPLDAVATRTGVPLQEVARPPSVTPPPVVDTPPPAPGHPARSPRLRRSAALAAGALAALLVVAGLAKHSAPAPGANAAVAAPTALVAPAPPGRPTAPEVPSAASTAPAVSPAASLQPGSAPPSTFTAPVPPAGPAPPAAPAAPQNLRMVSNTKRLNIESLRHNPLNTSAPAGLFLRAIPVRAALIAPKSQPAQLDMPASGL